MSTTYYRPIPPITSLRVEQSPGHSYVGVWINHQKSGELVVRNDELGDLLVALRGPEVAIRNSNIITTLDSQWKGCVISEYGKIFDSIGEIS